jgi:hypothetical protein
MAEVRSYHVMGVMTSDMASQMAVNVPVAGPRVSDEICHQQSPRESGLRRGILYTLARRGRSILCAIRQLLGPVSPTRYVTNSYRASRVFDVVSFILLLRRGRSILYAIRQLSFILIPTV